MEDGRLLFTRGERGLTCIEQGEIVGIVARSVFPASWFDRALYFRPAGVVARQALLDAFQDVGVDAAAAKRPGRYDGRPQRGAVIPRHRGP